MRLRRSLLVLAAGLTAPLTAANIVVDDTNPLTINSLTSSGGTIGLTGNAVTVGNDGVLTLDLRNALNAPIDVTYNGSFLGTEGPVYRWLRQYGTVAYFGFTCLNLLLTGNAVQALVRAGRLAMPRALEHAMVALATALVLLGVGNAIVAAAFGEPLKGRVENVTEWWGALIFVLGFCALALMWRRERAVLSLGVSPR